MSDSSVWDELLEAALHAHVSQRCQRAYAHELRNGLQGIYASVDVLSRIADGKAPANISTDKVKDIARRSLQSHEQGISEAVKQLTQQNEEPVSVDVGAVLRGLCGFLANDAAAHDVIVNISAADSTLISVRPNRFRVCLLALMTNAIDAMVGGGEINVETIRDSSAVSLRFNLLSNDASLVDGKEWRYEEDAYEEGMGEQWRKVAWVHMIKKEGGTTESHLLQEAPREARSYSNLRLVQLKFPTARAA